MKPTDIAIPLRHDKYLDYENFKNLCLSVRELLAQTFDPEYFETRQGSGGRIISGRRRLLEHPFRVSFQGAKASIEQGPVEIGDRGKYWYTGQTGIAVTEDGYLIWQCARSEPGMGEIVFQTAFPASNTTFFQRVVAKVTYNYGSPYVLQCQFSGISFSPTV